MFAIRVLLFSLYAEKKKITSVFIRFANIERKGETQDDFQTIIGVAKKEAMVIAIYCRSTQYR
ncbi:Predicted protein [Anoxybacillus flavithermus WK1]|uniref:Uncharacterized protein n=1 Tax=Anoxybacillus flavithermus (strain DSM 21510 / WK1) TaxID=491915 RepID=B7GLI1_ANOFW|nr:Predicted protein [Anoxybacillus flavithermus WK1]